MLTINIKGRLMDLTTPKVMGILNVTPDSFYEGSRAENEVDIESRVIKMINEGVDIIDVGGCSTRPGFEAPSLNEEINRVDDGCRIVRNISQDIPLSIDTFRAEVAEHCITKWDADIINDISGGKDPYIWEVAAENKIAYVLTHNPSELPVYKDVTAELITDISKKANELYRLGVNDVIIDPGFGFAKSLDENFKILSELEEIVKTGWPVLVGVSRKSMIYKTLECSPENSLTGTTVLNTIALMKGAQILRVHDVKEAKDAIKLVEKII